MVEVLVALGSNLGEREENVKKAMLFLSERMKILDVSSMYETEPMYMENQNWFVNCVVKLETDFPPRELLDYLKSGERKLGRKKTETRYGPRIVDLDILFYGNQVVRESELEIPHPRMRERGFVLVPLAEIEPNFIHPVYQKTISKLLAELNSCKSVIKR